MHPRLSSSPGSVPRLARAALALLLTGAAACEGGSAGTTQAVRTDSAGVTIVVNDSVDRVLPWTFTPRFALGGEESGPQSFYQLGWQSVGTDARGNLYVLDGGNHRVVVFDSSGAVVREMGGKGGGPGELEFPGFLVLAPDGVVGVYDHSREGLVRWSAAGEVLPVERVAEAGGPPPQLLRVVDGARVVHVEGGGGPDSKVRRTVLELRTAAGASGERPPVVTLASRETPAPTMQMFKSCPIGLALGPIFEPRLLWTTAAGRVYFASDTGYVVDVHDGTRRLLSVRRSRGARPATREMAVAEIGEGLKIRWSSNACTVDPAEVLEVRGVAPVLQAVARIGVAPDGSIWVTRGAVKDAPRIVDVFDAEGEYLGTLPEGAPEPVAFLPAGDVVAIEKDELDVERIVVYRVERPDAR